MREIREDSGKTARQAARERSERRRSQSSPSERSWARSMWSGPPVNVLDSKRARGCAQLKTESAIAFLRQSAGLSVVSCPFELPRREGSRRRCHRKARFLKLITDN